MHRTRLRSILSATIIAGPAVCLVSGCAQSPDAIAPAYVSSIPYEPWTCEQLAGEQARLSSALATASAQQLKARADDTAGVIFLGLPTGSMSGENIAPQIAQLKGSQIAVSQAAAKNACGSKPAAPSPVGS